MSPTNAAPLDGDVIEELSEELEAIASLFGIALPLSVLDDLTDHVADVLTAHGASNTQRRLISNHATISVAVIEATPLRAGHMVGWTAVADQDGILAPHLVVTYAHGEVHTIDLSDHAPVVQALRNVTALVGPLEPGHRHAVAGS